ncbi:Ump1p [Kluyveromyces lactis]|uniref:KLLA0E24509p n=1 Tax=Kluyveromyces lactis (strain ATCC 8585 / CBS 2359 / DSM 70799 / NBRC 1267 / NRRL Y-1140 / WM37) TaxID=284590 RepID=Q6CLY4_KLULA|nr:uncharacterized protein KLLA0_E24509g [Kluyveromyces lactis]CAH00142.1 KLLA0E24509p [Kluyveromyces lactis]|eukprot:XP_455055.1 uncharacterized protein KLLA0_E24509g [Kluyveromyces lactis]
MPMNIVPSPDFKSAVATDKGCEHQSNAVASLPDVFREQVGARPLNTQLNDRHPLESRVRNWDETQHKRQLEQYRQIFGVAEPMKRVMELKLVQNTDFNPLNQSNLHKDVLMNKEASIDWEDVYPTSDFASGMMVADDVHTKIEKRMGI